MPRTSPYEIRLTVDERRKLEHIARSYTSPHFRVLRAKIALLAADRMENAEIGEKLDLPRQIVSKWRKRFFRERMDGLEDRPGRGRRPVFSPSGNGAGEGTRM